eukprot:SAG11_NODE_28413_length_322_cov_0.538117_1_plen_31_part_10
MRGADGGVEDDRVIVVYDEEDDIRWARVESV